MKSTEYTRIPPHDAPIDPVPPQPIAASDANHPQPVGQEGKTIVYEDLNPGNDEDNPVQYKRLKPTNDKNLDYVCLNKFYL